MAGAEVTVRVPGRVNLIGDHTDYSGGLVLPMAIDRWTTLRGRPEGTVVRLASASEPDVVEFELPLTIDPSAVTPSWGRFVAGVVAELAPAQGFDGTLTTSIPVGAGLSSSAALGVAVALGLGFTGTAEELAGLVRRSEHRATGVPTGIMDQLCIASALEGHAMRIDCTTLDVTPVPLPEDAQIVVRFVAHRTLDGSGYTRRVAECHAIEDLIGPLVQATPADVTRIVDPLLARRARHVVTENARVRRFAAALGAGDLAAAGRVMAESHASLRDDYEVSTPEVDRVVAELSALPRVYGARMTGGGFGGCVVALCEPGADIHRGWTVRPVGAPVVEYG
jgi:galactokinase